MSAASDIRRRLPVPRTTLIGREKELESTRVLIQHIGVPLLTLTGSGGVGKTRLALAIAEQNSSIFDDRVVFVSLASISQPELVAPTIAQALGIHNATGGEGRAISTLIDVLDTKPTLLILDNFEQVISAASLVSELLLNVRNLQIIVTSRVPLRIQGEHEFTVDSLALPPIESKNGIVTVTDVEKSAAGCLFMQRVHAVAPHFTLTDDLAPIVAEICHRLDGLPLAIELAAARCKLLSPPELLHRLSDQKVILAGGGPDRAPRQQTFYNTISWSYDLLDLESQNLFGQLAVFAGDFTFVAAEAIVVPPRGQLLNVLTILVDHNLVRRRESSDGVSRFFLPHTIREFAAERLAERQDAATIHEAHASFFLEYAERAADSTQGTVQTAPYIAIEVEVENLRAALSWLILQRDKMRALRIALALATFWQSSSSLDEAQLWFEQCLALPGEIDPVLQSRISRLLGWLANLKGDIDQAFHFGQEAFDAAEKLDDQIGSIKALNVLGAIAFYRGDIASAKAYWFETKRRAELVGDSPMVASSLNNLGLIFAHEGNSKQAREYQEQSLVLNREFGNEIRISANLGNLAELALRSGDKQQAIELIQQSLELLLAARFMAQFVEGLLTGAEIATKIHDPQRATRLLAVVDRWYQRSGRSVPGFVRRQIDELRMTIEATLPVDQFAKSWEQGIAMTLDDAMNDIRGLVSSEGPVVATYGLTRREREVIVLLARGRSNQEIADQLFISLRTAQKHVSNILAKLDLNSRAAVAGYAVQHGLVPLSDEHYLT